MLALYNQIISLFIFIYLSARNVSIILIFPVSSCVCLTVLECTGTASVNAFVTLCVSVCVCVCVCVLVSVYMFVCVWNFSDKRDRLHVKITSRVVSDDAFTLRRTSTACMFVELAYAWQCKRVMKLRPFWCCLTIWRPLLPYGLNVRVPGCQKLQMTA